MNAIVEKKGLGMPVFKGFMANGAQAKWNVFCIVYEIGNPMVNGWKHGILYKKIDEKISI